MKRCNITAVVVTHNRKEILEECLEALEAQKAKPMTVANLLGEDLGVSKIKQYGPGGFSFDVLVVDNASTDGTEEYIQDIIDRHPNKLSYIRLEENLGGAGGFAFGMKYAVEHGASYVWVMDDDTIPEKDALEKLVQAMTALKEANVRFGFLSSKAVWTDGTPCKMNQQEKVEPRNEKQRRLMESHRIMPVKSATFVSLLIPAGMISSLGLPLKEYFIWGDDKEFTLRLSDVRNCFTVEDSVVVHKTKNNVGSSIIDDDLERIHRYYYAYRNDLSTARKRGGKEVLIYQLAYCLNWLRVVFRGKEGKGKRLAVMRQGRKDGKKFLPEIEYPEI